VIVMTDFKDRKQETAELVQTLRKRDFAFEIIYGRRRVGKTELILHATRSSRRIYYFAVGEGNLERFYAVCAECDPDVLKLRQDYEVLFDYLKDKVDVIIIDEFQNMVKENVNILSILQSIIDNKLKQSSLKLFILGSSISMMTSKVLNYSSPLYGRKTASLKLQPVLFVDLKEFYPKKSMQELVEIYGFAGGIPYYLNMIDSSFWSWLDKELARNKGFIKDEVDFLMKMEFDQPNTYKTILEAIAHGKNTIQEIREYTKLQRTDISPYLKNLMDVDFIERALPFGENQISRMGRYFMKDNFIQFWFRFIYPNMSSIEQGSYSVAPIRKSYAQYTGRIFEKICMQYVAHQKKYNKISGWWYAEDEIDIIAYDETNDEMLFCECKWQDNIEASQLLTALIKKAEKVRVNSATRKEKYVLFAKSFKKKISSYDGKSVACIDLKDMGKGIRKSI
jgi:AAA+ ATPase superfamily predicted ATPase